jgi:hypothetical protein
LKLDRRSPSRGRIHMQMLRYFVVFLALCGIRNGESNLSDELSAVSFPQAEEESCCTPSRGNSESTFVSQQHPPEALHDINSEVDMVYIKGGTFKMGTNSPKVPGEEKALLEKSLSLDFI